MSPSVSSLLQCQLATWQDMCKCSLAPHNWQSGVPKRPHFSKFEGDDRTSYTDLSRKDICRGSILHSSLQETLLSGTFHLGHVPCCPIPTALAFLSSSSLLCTSSCIMSRLSLPLVDFHCLNFDDPIHWCSTQMLPIMSRIVSISSACCSAWLALHFRPVLVCTLASLTFASFESLSVITRRHFDTLHYFIMDDRGSWSLGVRLYGPIDVKFGVTHSQLRRKLLTHLSIASAVDVGISYSIIIHINLDRTPCWYVKALYLQGRPDLSINLNYC